jgi:hypothetical protein
MYVCSLGFGMCENGLTHGYGDRYHVVHGVHPTREEHESH